MCQNVGKQGQVTEDLLCEIRVGKYSNTGCEHPFDFRTGFILRGIDSARCWRHSFRVFSQHWHDHHTFAIVLSIAYPWFKSFVRVRVTLTLTLSQRCATGLRFSECGSYLNSLSRSRNHLEMIWATTFKSSVYPEDGGTVVIKGLIWTATILR